MIIITQCDATMIWIKMLSCHRTLSNWPTLVEKSVLDDLFDPLRISAVRYADTKATLIDCGVINKHPLCRWVYSFRWIWMRTYIYVYIWLGAWRHCVGSSVAVLYTPEVCVVIVDKKWFVFPLGKWLLTRNSRFNALARIVWEVYIYIF